VAASEVGNNDRAVIQELLKEIAQTQQVDLNAKQRFKGTLPRLFLSNLPYLNIMCSGHHQRGRLAQP
jgi:hypothetical protein